MSESKLIADHRPKVSVCVVTYNQKDYISKCLQSLIDQETNFDFEVIVGDDCSTDGTSEIVANFSKSSPSIVRHIRHDKNIGAYKNYQFVHNFARTRGKYIAHVDGDDYALPGKLAAQVSVLDQDSRISLSAHAVDIVDGARRIGADPSLPELADIVDMLMLGTYFVNSSTMYRSINAFEHNFEEDIIDFYTHIEQASCGLIHLNKNSFGVYRWHSGGISKSVEHQKRIENAYERSFDRGLSLGVDKDIIEKARLLRRMKFGISHCLVFDDIGYKNLVKLTGSQWAHATMRHKIIHSFRMFPWLVRAYFSFRG